MFEMDFWENELNAIQADMYDREQELITMMTYEGFDYASAATVPQNKNASPNDITEQDSIDISALLQNIEQMQKEVRRIHGALFNPILDKQQNLEEQLTASILANSVSKRKNKHK